MERRSKTILKNAWHFGKNKTAEPWLALGFGGASPKPQTQNHINITVTNRTDFLRLPTTTAAATSNKIPDLAVDTTASWRVELHLHFLIFYFLKKQKKQTTKKHPTQEQIKLQNRLMLKTERNGWLDS